MNAMTDVRAAAHRAAAGSLNDFVEDVRVESAIGSDGDEILRVLIVLKEGVIGKIDGDRFIDTLMSIQKSVREAGDQRSPVISYATGAELAENGNSES